MVVGRGKRADIGLDDEAISRAHLRIRLVHDRLEVEDLGSTNGTYVNGRRVKRATLREGDRIQLGPSAVLEFAFQDELKQEVHSTLYTGAMRDGLTGAFQKRYLLDRLQREIAYCRRHGRRFSLLLLDLDHFQEINETYGHVAGDHLLKNLARMMAECMRAEDVLARFGGEEFAVLLMGCEDEDAVAFAERLRRRVAERPVTYGQARIPVTISAGVVTFRRPLHLNAEDLIAEADSYLYRAKQNGRNRVESPLTADP